MNKETLLQKLDHVAQLARASRWRRLAHRPALYLPATLYRHLVYPRWPRGWQTTAATFFGSPMQVVLPAGMDIYLVGGKTHDSELRLARFLIRRLEPGQVFCDVGAHFGYFSLLAARCVGEKGKVIALEASGEVFAILEENVQNRENITARHCAVSDREGTMTFYEFPVLYSEYNTGRAEQYQTSDWFKGVEPRQTEVPALPLDVLTKESGRSPDVIKIDVEGAEDQVVAGMSHLLQSEHPPLLAMEYLAEARDNAGHRRAHRRLLDAGYDCFAITFDGNLAPCPDPETYLSNQKLDSDNLVFVHP